MLSASQQGASDASRAVEEDRRLGIAYDQVLAHYFERGIQGAINAGNNTYGEAAPLEQREQYAVGWLAALVRLKMTNFDPSVIVLAVGKRNWSE